MARPLRIEFAGATYHVTSRGDRREPIFVDDSDRRDLLGVVGTALKRFDASMLAYCLMGNHYHFVLQTRQANLSLLMRHINGVYTQRFNRRHDKTGHLFQGRFKAILVDSEAYLVELCRYVELNPVRAGFVASPLDWTWSSCRAHVGLVLAPPWLDIEGLHAWLLCREATDPDARRLAAKRYAQLVIDPRHRPLWEHCLRQQIYLGDAAFVARMQAHGDRAKLASREIPSEQRQLPKTVAEWIASAGSRNAGLTCAHKFGGMSLTSISQEVGLSVSRLSEIVYGTGKTMKTGRKKET